MNTKFLICATALTMLLIAQPAQAATISFNLLGIAGPGLLPGNEPGSITGGMGGEIGAGITYDDVTNSLTINVGWGSSQGFTDLSSNSNNAHVHGPTSSNNGNGFTQTAGVLFGLTRSSNLPAGGTIMQSVTLTALQETDLLNGKHYINIHTVNNGGGEMRGFLVPVPTATTAAATSITSTGAVLNGTVIAYGNSTAVTFDHGATTSYGTNVAGTPTPVTGSSNTAVSATLSGLTPGATYHFRVNGASLAGTGNGNDLTFTTLTLAENWRLTYFGTTSNSGDAADTATPDKDGIQNLIKYGLVIVPGASGVSALPQGQKLTYAEGQRLALIFTRDPTRSDITIEVRAADTPGGSWTTIATSIGGAAFSGAGYVGETDAGGGLKTVEVRDTMNLSTATQRYMHIRVTR